jgi:HD-GYP domain-containing protein (c-di-GMP phosphodiesterase class II)
VADVFASLLEERPYKSAVQVTRALEMMEELVGTKVDVESLRALRCLVQEGTSVL